MHAKGRLRHALLLAVVFTAPVGAQVTTVVASTGPALEFGGVSSSTTKTLGVTGLGSLLDIEVRLDAAGACDATAGSTAPAIAHPRVGDITLRLVSPSNTSLVLMAQRGGARDNFCDVLFDDDGGFASIATLSSVNGQTVSGNFAPENPLSIFDGEDPNGGWTLVVDDGVVGQSGLFHRFALVLHSAAIQEIAVDVLGDPAPDGCLPGSCSLREAISLANARAGMDRVLLPAGELQLARAGAGEDFNADGDLDVRDSLEIVGQGAAATTLLQLTGDRVLQQIGARELTLRALTLANGSNVDRGGAVFSGGRLVLDGVALRDNRARLSGGAVHIGSSGREGAPPRFEIVDSVFEDNTAGNALADAAYGGALYSESSGFTSLHGRIVRSQFRRNEADDGGGAVALDAAQSVSNTGIRVEASTFEDNRVTSRGNGGAIGTNVGASGIVQLDVIDSSFIGNAVPLQAGADNLGGAVRARSGRLLVQGSDFIDNQARVGGAIASSDTNDSIIDSSTLCDNTASEAGGALAHFAAIGIRRSTFCDNVVTSTDVADDGGGAIAAYANTAIVRSTFDNNTALRGGALTLVQGDLSLQGSTLVAPASLPAGAEASLLRYLPTTAAPDLFFGHTLLIGRCTYASAATNPDGATYNTEASGNTCRLTLAPLPIGNQVAQSGAAINLAPLADNGGPTPTRLPVAPSIAIDAGANLSCIEPDQRGYARTDVQCDRGAVEAGAQPLPPAIFANGFEN